MADSYTEPPPDDESPAALLADAKEYVADNVDGWAASDASLETALLAAGADEAATLWALVREEAKDKYRDFGRTVLGVSEALPAPSSTTTTWTARTAAPVGGFTLPPGTTLAANSPAGTFGFAVVEEHVLAEGETVLEDVLVRAVIAGTASDGAAGAAQFDDPPAWVASAVLDAPSTGGSNGESDESHLAKIVRAGRHLSRSIVDAEDLELAAQEITEIERCMVRDNYDHTTSLDSQERTSSLYPINAAGEPISPGGKALWPRCSPSAASRTTSIGSPTPPTPDVDAEITVARVDTSVDGAALEAAVLAAANRELDPARHGGVSFGDVSRFRRTTKIRRYELAAAADVVPGAAWVVQVKLAESGDTLLDADLDLAGSAPLPRPGTVSVIIVEAE